MNYLEATVVASVISSRKPELGFYDRHCSCEGTFLVGRLTNAGYLPKNVVLTSRGSFALGSNFALL